jgi:hypothetical protein
MTSYYDEETNTTYYDPQMVINITEYYDGKSDTNVFLVYDAEDDLVYLYGARGEHSKYVRYEKTFNDVNVLYKFLSELVANHDISLSVNYLTSLTNYDDYDSLRKRVDRTNEVVAYDNIKLTKRLLEKYTAAFF